MIWLLLAQAAPVTPDPVVEAVAAMTLEEKAAQLQSTAPAAPEAGLPAYDWWNEGLHGLARNGPATVFPQAIALAATWDADLLRRVGDVVSTEARARFNARPAGADRRIYEGLTIWSPNINIFRDPRWGRGQETYGEDPYLSGSLAVGFIRGLQGPDPRAPKVIATPKHLAVHSGPEAGRDGFDVDPSPRDLEATYLPAFRMAITEGKARSVMCAYNAVHGVPVCALPSLMVERVRRDWGFQGFSVSDCDAVANIHLFHHYRLGGAAASAAALKGGTDLNCGSAYGALPTAVRQGLLREAEVDGALVRVLSARRDLGIAFGAHSRWSAIRPEEVATPGHRAVALEAARKSIVLLRNEHGLLPLDPRTRLAVIGANADDLGVLQGNYHGTAADPVTPLAGLRQRFASVSYAQGSILAEGAPVVMPGTALRDLRAEYQVDGKTVLARTEPRIDLDLNRAAPGPGVPVTGWRGRWTGRFAPPGPGRYRLVLDQAQCWKDCTLHDTATLTLGGRVLHAGALPKGRVELTIDSDGSPQPIALELDHRSEDESIRLLWLPPAEPLLAEAVGAARAAEVAVVVVGLSPDLEGEALQVQVPGFVGGDRTDIGLPQPQARLVEAIRATGKPMVLVLASGSAVSVDPSQADAILALWYPGEAGGTALADTLAGANNPSGRLPVTFYRSTGDLPAFIDYGMKERTYRYFTGQPLWGFGHGLSYTRFHYSGAAARAGKIGEPVTVTVRVANTGSRPGEEVVQAYVVPPAEDEALTMTDPVLQRQLAGFARVSLAPGMGRTVSLAIDPRGLSSVARDGTRRVLPGKYRVWIGGGQPGDGPGQWVEAILSGSARELPK
ncbi:MULTISPECIES: glycoside hydrolase family 3 C-terminal domain-containing protein [unclassified Sphingomonas]|uniref:glycoside hydrolase family 3 C-terminal domain-containing protein n=1 Tax=Sphingomonas TaxID=13687 RepID=UPI00095947D1|nr:MULTISPECIES: glycoside hydrolase family 3 C-terminal domain-containing protein [unclassified Sphingomonas]MBN8813675.1 glycoside hydrolase family 3 C-terminal domain-containing protein [Sphingomonas sp.]OJY54095.1 MAG: beta-glucosidase [Sphingomonas sp. 67-41]